MPREMTINYVFGGPVTQDYYTESEMASALEMTVEALRATLDEDLYGPAPEPDRCIYSYHIHPLANGGKSEGEFLFYRACYRDNLLANNVRNWLIQTGVWTKETGYACSRWLVSHRNKLETFTEESALTSVKAFVAAWNRKDLSHHKAITAYWEHQPVLRQIWQASGYLEGTNSAQTDDGIRFFGPDEPREGTFIPWQWLRLSRAIGFFNALDFPKQPSDFMPNVSDWILCTDQPLRPGNLIVVEKWVYDDYRRFIGMAVKTDGDTVWITDNGRHLMDFDRDNDHLA